jgi:hypothetical protein
VSGFVANKVAVGAFDPSFSVSREQLLPLQRRSALGFLHAVKKRPLDENQIGSSLRHYQFPHSRSRASADQLTSRLAPNRICIA